MRYFVDEGGDPTFLPFLFRMAVLYLAARIAWLAVTDLPAVGTERQGEAIWGIGFRILLAIVIHYAAEAM